MRSFKSVVVLTLLLGAALSTSACDSAATKKCKPSKTKDICTACCNAEGHGSVFSARAVSEGNGGCNCIGDAPK